MAEMGRPKIEIDWNEFDKLCGIQCTLKEIASWFDCSPDTIENRCKSEKHLTFSDYWTQKAGTGKISLRRQQWQLAMKGDKTMLIWLGKQYLEQSDKQELDLKTIIRKISNMTDQELDKFTQQQVASHVASIEKKD